MIEPFNIDCNTKYPHIYDNPEKTFEEKIAKAIDYGDITKGRKRYRHKEVKAADLLRGISAEK